MQIIKARNVNDAFYEGMQLIHNVGEKEYSRGGDVLVVPYPVMTVTARPMERVLFDHTRDANPFFHLMEGLWMLAGRNDAEFLQHYLSDFGTRFAEKDGTIHGAYGYRWRKSLGFDQLDTIVIRLRREPSDRQCVLQMWDTAVDGGDDMRSVWRDRPCNTHAYFRMHDGQLDLTICCRSNDLIWGAHGANAVHFSMLLEYMAGRIGVLTGKMYQLSNNYHGYADILNKLGDPDKIADHNPYDDGYMLPLPMAEDWGSWDADLHDFMVWHDSNFMEYEGELSLLKHLSNQWFHDVAGRMAVARWHWTHGFKPSAIRIAEDITAPDWRQACLEWFDRRKK